MALYAFDGTWNVRDGKDVIDHVRRPNRGGRAPLAETVETNVSRMGEFYRLGRTVYLQGVGTRFSLGGRVAGGAFGLGARYRIRRMYRRLCENYTAGDTCIDLIGFSRGAAQAVHFANLINEHGIGDPTQRSLFTYSRDFGFGFHMPKPIRSGDSDPPTIHFLGLFDTVATFGWPIGPLRNASRVWKVWTIPPNVDRAFHAMALDEIRKTFALVQPTMFVRDGATEAEREQREKQLYEMWFRGAHANVGGGYLDRGLSDIALAWMMTQALWTWRRQGRPRPHGFRQALRLLQPDPPTTASWQGTTREQLRPNPDGALGRPRQVPRKPAWRQVPPGANVHQSALDRTRNMVGDHYNLNRPLLRIVPGDALISFDPPQLYAETEAGVALQLANELFNRIPVVPESWLRLDETPTSYLFRGGSAQEEWLAEGTLEGRTADDARGLSRNDFVRVASVWLLNAADLDTHHSGLAEEFAGSSGGFDNNEEAIAWIARVMERLWPLSPRRPENAFLLNRFERAALAAQATDPPAPE